MPSRYRWALLAPVLLALLVGARAAAQSPPVAFHGARGELDIPVPKLAERVTIDGALDEPAWGQAALLTGFSQYSPVDGAPAADSTDVLVWYSDDAIYFAIRAFERHGAVHARLADRDRIESDDHVQILLDTFNDGRRAFVFGVNPLGVQSDGIRAEEGAERQRLFSAETNENPVDLNPDFLYESVGRVTPEGYEIEVAIPLKSLRYQSAREQSWGINIIRSVQHSRHLLTWTAARRGRASFLSQSGRLTGLRGLRRGLVLDLNPVATAKVEGAPAADRWNYDTGVPELGGNVRWGVTANLMLNGTVNPDFSQVEADAGQTQLDPRRALFFDEKRPFFLEASERFQTPNRIIYTRRVADPVAAAKLAGKVSGLEVGYLGAVDNRALSGEGEYPVFNILRMRKDIGGESAVGLVYTDRVEGSRYNRVGGADARLVFGGVYTVALQGVYSLTRTAEGTSRAPLWDVSVNRQGRRFGFEMSARGMDPEFVAASGFLDRTGTFRARLAPRLTFYSKPGAALESWTTSVNAFGNWLYDDLFDGRPSEALHLWFNNAFAFRGGWRLSTSLIVESFGYPAYLFSDYAVERRTAAGIDTVGFVGTTSRIPNYGIVVSAVTPSFTRFDARLSAIYGRDENWDEWAPAYLIRVDGGVGWRPTDQVRVDASLVRQQYVRPSDASLVSSHTIPRLKIEYQLSRAIFVRFVGQYDARFRDALRDDTRTDDPLLIRNIDTGLFERAVERTENDFRMDALFSFRPDPGTVIFAGYGASLTEAESFRFRGITRRSDGFFLKASYLFRL